MVLQLLTAIISIFLSVANVALAGDYALIYAISIPGTQTSGEVTDCFYEGICIIESDRFSISIVRRFKSLRRVYVSIGSRDGCCYFGGGAKSTEFEIDLHEAVHQLPIFAGIARKGNEFVVDEKIGDLYLGFSDLR